MPTETTKITILDRILAFLKTDEKSQVIKVLGKAGKIWANQVRNGERELEQIAFDHASNVENLNEKIEDAKVRMDESFLQIDTTVKGSEDIENYITEVYEPQIVATSEAYKDLVQDLKDAEEDYNKEKDALIKQINFYKDMIAKVK